MTMKEEKQMDQEPSISAPIRKKPAVKKAPAKKVIAEPVIEVSENTNKAFPQNRLIMATLLLIAFSFTGGYLVGSNSNSPKVDVSNTSTFTDVVAGKVALDESELVAAVKKLGISVYWAGPVKGAKYTLAVPSDGQAYVRYLPNGQGINDTNPNYVVIATYKTDKAFDATQAAGNQSNGVTFVNANGAAVYYNKTTPTNVYVAYPGQNYQIEIFDPIAKTALDIASKSGALKLVA
jgi:hypothetical protein